MLCKKRKFSNTRFTFRSHDPHHLQQQQPQQHSLPRSSSSGSTTSSNLAIASIAPPPGYESDHVQQQQQQQVLDWYAQQSARSQHSDSQKGASLKRGGKNVVTFDPNLATSSSSSGSSSATSARSSASPSTQISISPHQIPGKSASNDVESSL